MVTHHVAFILDVGRECRQTHVELRSIIVAKPHRLMRQSGIAQGAVDAMFFFQNLEDGRVKRRGVDDSGALQEDTVKMDGFIGNMGGIYRKRGEGLRLFGYNGVGDRLLWETQEAERQYDNY